jgi:hypothetical protein
VEALINRVRIVGLQYDSATIHTGDTLYDYAVVDEATGAFMPFHGMNILRNGGGKGVFFQTFFQPLDPLCSWKEDKNQVVHFFFNEQERPIFYTIHVIEEWQVRQDQMLMIGISIAPKANAKERKETSNSPLDLEYLLFTKVYEKGSFDISSLPLWDASTKESIDLAEWKKLLNQQYPDFQQFNRNSKQDYFELLDSYGLSRNNIHMLKHINVHEGNIAGYFENAMDNMGLFQHLILPTINGKIEGIDPKNEISNLTKLFHDTLKIAKDLPRLYAMTEHASHIVDMVYPIKELLQQGFDYQADMRQLEQRGYANKLQLEKMEKENQILLAGQEHEQKQLAEHIADANWKLDNLNYAMYQNQLEHHKGFIFENEDVLSKLANDISAIRRRILAQQTCIKLKQREQWQEQVHFTQQSITSLIDASENKYTQEQIDRIKHYFEEHWPAISDEWSKKLSHFQHYLDLKKEHLKEEGRRHHQSVEDLGKIKNSIGTLRVKIAEHENKINLKVVEFGEKARHFLDECIKDSLREMQQAEKDKDEKRLEFNNIQGQIQQKNLFMGELNEKIKQQTREKNRLEVDLPIHTRKEEELSSQSIAISRSVQQDLMDRVEWKNQKNSLSTRLAQMEENLSLLIHQGWEKEIDADLIDVGAMENDIWIPNRDLVRVKRHLEEQGVPCIYGPQILKGRPFEEIRRELKQNPALLHSVVVLDDAFEKIDYSIFEEQIFHSEVHIINRKQMHQSDIQDSANPSLFKQSESTYVVRDRGSHFIFDEEQWSYWKIQTEKETDDIAFEVDTAKKAILHVQETITQIELLLANPLAIELKEAIEEKVGAIVSLQKEVEEIRSDIAKCQQQAAVVQQQEKQLELEMRRLSERKNSLIEWKKECDAFEHNKSDLNSFEKKLQEVINQIEESQRTIDQLEVELSNGQGRCDEWEKRARSFFLAIHAMLTDVSFPHYHAGLAHVLDESNLKMPKLGVHFDPEAFALLQKHQDLQRSQNERDSRLTELRYEERDILSRISAVETELFQLDTQWQEMGAPLEEMAELEKTLRELQHKETEKQGEHTGLQKQMENVAAQIEVMEPMIRNIALKIKEDHGKDAFKLPAFNVDKEKDMLKRSISQWNKQLKLVEDKTRAISHQLQEVQTLVSSLQSLNIPSSFYSLSAEEELTLRTHPQIVFNTWLNELSQMKDALSKHREMFSRKVQQVRDAIERSEKLPDHFKVNANDFLSAVRESTLENAMQAIENFLQWAQDVIENGNKQKEKGEEAVKFWVHSAAKRVDDVLRCLREMESKMKVRNWHNHMFPLVKLQFRDQVPKSAKEIMPVIKEYCCEMIEEFVTRHENVDDLHLRNIAKQVNISSMVRRVLGEFPRLKVYIPEVDGPLLRSEPKNHYYKDWESINLGGTRSATKSGGQTLLAQFIVMAMMMRQKANKDSWLFLASDNPFGTMSSPELIEAVFALLEAIQVQWLVVTPPITNVHITSKFNTIYHLDIVAEEGEKRLIKSLEKQHRKYIDKISIIEENQNEEGIS